MLEEVEEKLVEKSLLVLGDATIDTAVVGATYTFICLSDGFAGVAGSCLDFFLNPPEDMHLLSPSCCTVVEMAGDLSGSRAADVLKKCIKEKGVDRAVAYAIINAAMNRSSENMSNSLIMPLLMSKKTRKVCMVGYFPPVVSALRSREPPLDSFRIFDRAKGLLVDNMSLDECLSEADTIILTATSLINGSFASFPSSILNDASRDIIILGPSTPLCPEAFSCCRGVKLLGGAVVKDESSVRMTVQEGGGTRNFLKYCTKVDIRTSCTVSQ